FGSSLSVRINALIVFALAKFSASLPAAHASHPAEIGAGRKGDAAPGEDDNPRFAVRAERLECIGQRMDDAVVDGVAHLRTVDRAGRNAARVLGDENGRFAHLIGLRHWSLSTRGIVRLHHFSQSANRYETALTLGLCENPHSGVRLTAGPAPRSRVSRRTSGS